MWPFKSKRHHGDAPDVEHDRTSARLERARAEAQLRQTRARYSEVYNISRTLREVRERNHFATLISEAISGKQK